MAGAEVLDRLVAGVVTDFKFYRIQAECEAKSRELRAECEARTLEKMLQILKRMQQAVGNLKVSIEAKESVDIATQESEPMVQLSTQPDSIIENVKEVSVMVTEDSENGENTMEIISTDIVVVQNTPGVCQNVPMAWYSHFAMLMDFGCNLNRIWRQNKLVRLGKPPAKPPDYVLLHFWGFIDHLVSLEMVKKSTVNVGYLWKRMRTKYVQPVTIIYGVLVVARAAKVLGDPFQVAPQTRRRMIFYNIHLGFHCYMGMIELLNCAVGFGPGQQNPAPPISEELSKKIIDQLRTSREEAAKLTSDGPPRAAETQIAEDAGVSNLDGVPRASEARRVADIKFINVPSGGSGRGKLENPAASDAVEVRAPGSVGEVNRHMKVARHQARDPTAPRLPPEEAVQKAMEILRKKSEASGDRGRVGGRGRGLARGRGRGRKDEEDEEVEMYLGDDADGEKLAKRLGPEMMNQLTEVFDEAFNNVSPSPMHEAYEDALQTNYAIELEPEWHFGDVNSNPDIHDTPPIPLRDALEKMKPFIMAYENIQSQEEWEEVVEEVMNKKLPVMKKIVDRYAGDDVVTALDQQQELNRVADTLPQQSPASIRKFASNSILSLQSNPGWGSKKKFQFMDKLVTEVSKHYQ